MVYAVLGFFFFKNHQFVSICSGDPHLVLVKVFFVSQYILEKFVQPGLAGQIQEL